MGALVSGSGDGDVVVVGFPFDEGCTRNGGRAGAKFGPGMVSCVAFPPPHTHKARTICNSQPTDARACCFSSQLRFASSCQN